MTTTTITLGKWQTPVPPYWYRVRYMARGYNPVYAPRDYDTRVDHWSDLPHAEAYFSPQDWNWIHREQDKQRRQPVPPLPMGLEDRYPEHCVYLSAVDGMIAYTPDYLYGRQDRQVRMKPGKYLAKYYPEIPAHVAATWTHACAPKELTISQDADEIADVYFHGPPSCQHPDSPHGNQYTRDHANHPTRMYAGPDLGLAYLGDRKAAIARAVVWPEKLVYSRIYGERSIAERLEALGYRDGSLAGARCRLRMDGERIIVPYVDGSLYGQVEDGCLVLNDDGEGFDLAVTQGYVTEGEETCYCSREGCDRECDEDESYCSYCNDQRWTCDDCGNEYFSDDTCPNGENGAWCDSCYADHVTTCEGCSDTFEEGALPYRVRRARSGWQLSYCPECAEERHECSVCGDVCENDSPCCETPDDDDSDDTTEDGTPDSVPTMPTVPEAVPEAVTVPPVTFERGQMVVFIASGNWHCQPGQIGTVARMADGYAQVVWDRRSGTDQCDGGYLTTIRIATPEDIQAYNTRYGEAR